jgi:Flp pilus assembly pilin Flp
MIAESGVDRPRSPEGVEVSLYLRVTDWFARFTPQSQRGQGLAEYALILALIAIVAIVALIFLGGQVSGILSKVGKSV